MLALDQDKNMTVSGKIVTPVNALAIINQLGRIKSPNVPIEYVREKLEILLTGFAHTSIVIAPAWGKLHRAVKYGEKPKFIKNLWYPPKERAGLSRANLSQNPMFYCSGNPMAIFYELGLKPGDMVATTKWKLKDEILVSPLGYTADAFRRLNASRACPIVVPEDKKHMRELDKTNIRIFEFIHDLFTKIVSPGDEYIYKLTAIIAEFFLTLEPDCGVVYPSIAMRANAENFALTPSLVHNRLELESVKWCRVDSVENFTFTITPLEFSDTFDKDGLLGWKALPENERGYL